MDYKEGARLLFNCAIVHYHNGTLQDYGIEAPCMRVKAIMNTEDRHLFAEKLTRLS